MQQIEQPHDLSLSTNDAFRPVCRYWDRIVRPAQLMSAMLNAMRALTDPADTGAVCVALPQDVQGEAYDYPESFFQTRVWTLERRPATAAAIERAAKVIRGAKKPLVICGGGVRYSEAHDELQTFCETTGIPFAETQAGRSAIVWDHPLNLGGLGVTGCSAANAIAREADVVIGVGTRYTDFTTSSKWLFREDAQFVNLNVSEFQAYKLDAVAVIADAKQALPVLQQALAGYRAPYIDEIVRAKADWATELERLSRTVWSDGYTPEIRDANNGSIARFASDLDASLTQTSVVAAINEAMEPEDVVIGAAGSLPGDLQRMWRARARDTYNMEYGYSTMGYEVAGAFGVKLAVGDAHEVYAMCGDGSFNMLHSELLTAVQEHKKINICLFDNASFGCINNLQVGHGNETLCTELRFRSEGAGDLRVKASVLFRDSASAPVIPEEVRSAMRASSTEVSGTLTDDTLRLLQALSVLYGQDTLSADIDLSADCGPIVLSDTLQYDRHDYDGQSISCIRKNTLAFYFSDGVICDESGNKLDSADLVDSAQLIDLSCELLMNGTAACAETENGRSYSLTLDEDGMAALSAAIAPGIKTQNVSFTSGRIEALVGADGALRSISISCSGALHLILTDAPAAVSAVITREVLFSQQALSALK